MNKTAGTGSRTVVGTLITLTLVFTLVESGGASPLRGARGLAAPAAMAPAPSPGPGAPDSGVFGDAAAATATGAPVTGASPDPSGSPALPMPAVESKLAPAELKLLQSAFARAQRTELKALEHRNRAELRELKASQNARYKEFWAKERETQREHFKTTTKGAEKRDYVQKMHERRIAFQATLRDEYQQRQRLQEVRLEAVRKDQEQRLKEAQEHFDRGERPPERLWPIPGR